MSAHTPITDAAKFRIWRWDNHEMDYAPSEEAVPAQLSANLERQRDELLGLVEKMASIIGPPGEETWADDFDIEAAWDAYQKLTNQIRGSKP